MDSWFKNGRSMLLFELGIFLVIAPGVLGAPKSDLVERLPGQNDVKFKQYAGYVTISADRALFYYFVEADVATPTSRPLALWLTGGPGCSSLGVGAFEENGPFRPRRGVLENDPYSWNKETNVLYVESPIGVGYSYSNNSKDYENFNDADAGMLNCNNVQAAKDNLAFILNWYKKFPEYRDLDFYITGESYAGHYIPQLTALVLQYNKKKTNKPINLKGISLGNPFVDIELSINNGPFLWSHGQISDRTYRWSQKVCNTSTQWVQRFGSGTLSEACEKVARMMDMDMGLVNAYDVISDNCLSNNKLQARTLQGEVIRFQKKIPKQGVDPCIENEVFSYFNRKDVQKALHANISGRLSGPWDTCFGIVAYDNRDRLINIIPILSDILKAGVPTLLYGGDEDSVVPFSQTRTIADKKLAKELHLHTIIPYRTWYSDKQIAGWTQTYGHRKHGKNHTILTFATVRGASHEVPYTNPSQGLTLYRSFIGGLPLPSE